MGWKNNEKGMYDAVKSAVPSLNDIKWAEGNYSRFDAYNKLAICEFKYRKGKKWEDTLIEHDKYQAMKDLNGGRVCLYIVQTEGIIYIFNLNKLVKEEWDFKWKNVACNTTTEFANRAKKMKYVGYIDWDQAIYTIDADTKEIITE